jgi:acetyl-CoA carboxylase biotin carboxyl carrier protein
MESKEIQKLIDFIAHSPLDEVSIETSEIKLSVKRYSTTAAVQHSIAPQTVAAPQVQNVAPVAAPQVIVEAVKSNNYIEVKSPMIGTFYKSANADSAPFVEIGSEIKKGQTLCIIEAMKLFNEIESEIEGKIVKILVDNASPVEYDQVLFLVEPN